MISDHFEEARRLLELAEDRAGSMGNTPHTIATIACGHATLAVAEELRKIGEKLQALS